MEPTSSPRISFSADFLDDIDDDDDKDFISISPGDSEVVIDKEQGKAARNAAEFEFLSSKMNSESTMTAADELFFEGKLLPFWQRHCGEKLNKISLKTEEEMEQSSGGGKEESGRAAVSWFLDDDPSPRPPKCTVLWKELLRLRKQRATSSLSPSSSTSSSTSSSSDESQRSKDNNNNNNNKNMKMRVKKGLERTRSATIRVRPVINVPICTQGKTTALLPPIFSLKKGKLER